MKDRSIFKGSNFNEWRKMQLKNRKLIHNYQTNDIEGEMRKGFAIVILLKAKAGA